MARHNIHALLEASGGLVRIERFLPDHVATGLLAALEAYPDAVWNHTSATEDHKHNNIAHAFWSTKSAPGLDVVARALALLLPGELHTFSAGKYCRSHHIAPHDDRAYTQVLMDDGTQVTCSRTVALIYYLTQDWKPEYGGALVDLEGPKTLVPRFNSAVVFRVPRYHQVTAMTVDRPRYSIFGWFLEPGKRYDLYRGNPNEGGTADTLRGADRTATPARRVEERTYGAHGHGDDQGRGGPQPCGGGSHAGAAMRGSDADTGATRGRAERATAHDMNEPHAAGLPKLKGRGQGRRVGGRHRISLHAGAGGSVLGHLSSARLTRARLKRLAAKGNS